VRIVLHETTGYGYNGGMVISGLDIGETMYITIGGNPACHIAKASDWDYAQWGVV